MVFNKFKGAVIIRIFLIFLNQSAIISGFILFKDKSLLFIPGLLFIILIVQIVNLFKWISTTNFELSKFMFAVRNSDHTVKFSGKLKDLGFGDLQESLQDNIQLLNESKIEKETYLNFLNILINKLKTGIICIEEPGKISLINDSAKNILEQQSLTNLDQIANKHKGLYETVNKMTGDSNQLVEIKTIDGVQPFSVILHKLKILNTKYRIISIQNIKNEMEIKELEAWNKLVKILNHEIMNSVTPLASLTDTILMLVEDNNEQQKELKNISEQNIKDIRTSIRTIKKRSHGLMEFVEDYRKLSKLPAPDIKQVSINDIIDNISKLMKGQLEISNVKLSVDITGEILVNIDPGQIDQVLINIINNSLFFLKNIAEPEIKISAEKHKNLSTITISDNGIGIPEEDYDKVFIPFYSTKPSGTGIGLSLCRQIMQAHKGKIILSKTINSGACFKLIFPL